MNKYESVVIINPSLEAEAIKALIKKFSGSDRKSLRQIFLQS